MKWSWRLGRVAGIDLNVHATFLLLLGWVGVSHWLRGGAPAAADGILFITALFGCVLLHELGHSLTARRYGIATRDITLLLMSGRPPRARMLPYPSHEGSVAVGGPAV